LSRYLRAVRLYYGVNEAGRAPAMKSEEHNEPGQNELKGIRIQLVQIKYILAGLLGFAIFGRSGDIFTDLTTLAVTLASVYSVEGTWTMIRTSTVKLGNYFKRRKAAVAWSEIRMREILAEVEELEKDAVANHK
jgi:hypothetical protein